MVGADFGDHVAHRSSAVVDVGAQPVQRGGGVHGGVFHDDADGLLNVAA
jgi:hypothetical protein